MATTVCHKSNENLGRKCDWLAEMEGLQIKHHSSGVSPPFDGYHRWVISPQGSGDPACNRKTAMFYTEARYSKYFQPSIVGERQALEELLDWFEK